jgi:hypothetical protein
MKTYEGVNVLIHIFFTPSLFGGEWSDSRSDRFTTGERVPGTHSIAGWMGPRAGLDDVEKRKFFTLPEFELRPLCGPARNQSLYRLWICLTTLSLAGLYSVEWTTQGSEFESRWGQKFSLLPLVQTGSGIHPTSYPMRTGGSFSGGKAAGAWSWPLTYS